MEAEIEDFETDLGFLKMSLKREIVNKLINNEGKLINKGGIKYPKRFPNIKDLTLLLRKNDVEKYLSNEKYNSNNQEIELYNNIKDYKNNKINIPESLKITNISPSNNEIQLLNNSSSYFLNSLYKNNSKDIMELEDKEINNNKKDIDSFKLNKVFNDEEINTVMKLSKITNIKLNTHSNNNHINKEEIKFKEGIPIGKNYILDKFKKNKKVLDNMKSMNNRINDYKSLLIKKKIK